MARLSKPELLAKVEEAIRASGWNLLYISTGHPRRYAIYKDDLSAIIKVYIWNITHGGKSRAADEYRIQITGVSEFDPEPDGRTFLLGWWDDVGVFAGWDIRQHLGTLGASPSMQISEHALRQALLTGLGPYTKSNGETAIAFRPDFMGAYLESVEALHDIGRIPSEAKLLGRLGEAPEAVGDDAIEHEIAGDRRVAVVSTRRALRAIDFSARVLTAYSNRCAMCGIQLRLIEGAHILPVAAPGSTDQTCNGVALCVLHHRAYDRGLGPVAEVVGIGLA